MAGDMRKEMERGEPVEIMPENIGEMPALEATPLLERAALRTEVLGWKGELWVGLRENLRGIKAWVDSQGAEATKKTLSVITTASFVAASVSACVNGPSTPEIPSDTAPRVIEVSPTPTSTEMATPTATLTPEPTSTPVATEWQVVGKDYKVVLGENGIPVQKFVEGQGWQKVEQVSMVDAFGNTVPGWVVEKSDAWDGEISQLSSLKNGQYNPISGLSFALVSSATLKQWELMEFINSNGSKVERLNLTWMFKNDQGKIITVKASMSDLNLEARIEKSTPKQFIDSLIVGSQTQILAFVWVDALSATTPEKLAELSNKNAIDGDLCKQSVQACGLSIGRMGDTKHPASWFKDVYNGLSGDNLDIPDELWCERLHT